MSTGAVREVRSSSAPPLSGHVARLTGPGWQATSAEPFKPGQNMRGGGGLAHRRVGEVKLISAPARALAAQVDMGSQLTSSSHRQRTGSGTPTGFWLRSRS